MLICLRQGAKIRIPNDLRQEGHGDCSACMVDYKNQECSGYEPIYFIILNVGGQDESQEQLQKQSSNTGQESCRG